LYLSEKLFPEYLKIVISWELKRSEQHLQEANRSVDFGAHRVGLSDTTPIPKTPNLTQRLVKSHVIQLENAISIELMSGAQKFRVRIQGEELLNQAPSTVAQLLEEETEISPKTIQINHLFPVPSSIIHAQSEGQNFE